MKSILCSVGLFFAAAHSCAAEAWWPQFLGPNCSGVSEIVRPRVEFGPGHNQLWKVAIPGGLSSPVVWGDRIFLTVFAAGGDSPKILHQLDFKERIAATPAFVQGQLYLRTPTAPYAFGQ